MNEPKAHGVVWATIFAGAALTVPVLGGGAGLYFGLLNKLGDMRVDISRNSEYRVIHISQMAELKERIVDNEEGIRKCQLALDRLSHQSNKQK